MSDPPPSRPRSSSRSAPGLTRPVSPARTVALRVLSDLREGRRTAREAIDDLVDHHRLDPRERALAYELVLGVVRHRLTLARIVGAFAARGWKNINRRLQHILMLAAYQIIWLDSVPSFAAVSEAANQARVEGGPRLAGFVNGLLRQLIREIEQRRIPTATADPVRSVPIDTRWSFQLTRPVLPDPSLKPAEHLGDATSHPTWLVQRWLDAYGAETTRQVCMSGILRPPFVARPNRMRITAPELAERLARHAHDVTVTADQQALVFSDGPTTPIATDEFHVGLFQPQDRTAMDPVLAMKDLGPGQVAIDLCAGLGTKSTQMAERMNDEGVVLACELDESKIAMIESNCERLGHRSVRTALTRDVAAKAAELPRIDWILIDAPCSNTGVFARRPEARYRLNMRALADLAGLQVDLLAQAADLARPGTRLVYSTCSIDPEENENAVTAFLAARPEWRLADSRLTLPRSGNTPADWRDGGFWALLQRDPA